MQTIDLGRIDGDEPRARDWRLFERAVTACAIATLLLSMAFIARALPELARHPVACAPAAVDAPRPSSLPDAARGELAALIARVAP